MMKRFKLAFVSTEKQTIHGWVSERLSREGIDAVELIVSTPEEIVERAIDADMLWAWGPRKKLLKREHLAALPRCGAIVRPGSGVDELPVTAATELGIVIAHTPEAFSDSVSDHTIALLFAVLRQVCRHDCEMRSGKWDATPLWTRRCLRRQTLGLVGFGHVPRRLVEKLVGFELTVLAYDPYASSEMMESLGVRAADLEEVLTQSDILSLHCPMTRETRHLIDKAALQMMKPEAILINTARGGVIDETALVQGLSEGWIAAAGLDVFEQKPIDPDNPLLNLDNVVATPHAASATEGIDEAALQGAVDAVITLANGRWPPAYVNRDVKPRWNLE